MEITTVNNSGTNIILEYVFKKTSWRELYFSKLSGGQKILFFLPVLFLYFPIYGTYDLFHRNSWFLFLSFGVIMLVSIWAFFKQKSYLEQKVFEKYYLSDSCKTALDYHLGKISMLLGDENTIENRALWKNHFKIKHSIFPFIIFLPVFGFMCFQHLIRPYNKDFFLGFYFGWISIMILLMSFAFIMPAISDFKFKIAAHNEAFKLISELDNKMTRK
jgi:hypothetical protein